MKIELNNTGKSEVYYPRLMVNKHNEIVLATHKFGTLTSGLYCGQVDDSEPHWSIGKKFDDWEVAGELKDYNGRVTVTFENRFVDYEDEH